MWHANIYSYIKVYQKYIGTSILVGSATRSQYASSGPKAEGVRSQRGRVCSLKCEISVCVH